MEYNTKRPQMHIREYGRNIEKMVAFACTIEDRDKRNNLAKSIIRIMGQINPQLRDSIDWRHKLYDHLFVISDFKLDIDSPYPIPSRESLESKPNKVPYASNHIRFRHYGKILQQMVRNAAEFPDNPKKTDLLQMIVNQMKRSYLYHNQEHLTEEMISQHLSILSNGAVTYSESMRTTFLPEQLEPIGAPKKRKNKNKKKFKKL